MKTNQKMRVDLADDFFKKYQHVLEAAAGRVHHLERQGYVVTPTAEIAEYIRSSLPTLFRKTFGGPAKEFKLWRVISLLSNAAFLGAYEDLDIRVVRGKGMTTVTSSWSAVKPKKYVEGKGVVNKKLRVIKGGKR